MGVLTSVCSGVGDRLMAQLCWPGTQDGTWAPPGRTAQAEEAPGGLPHRTSRRERWRVEGELGALRTERREELGH